MISGLRFVLAVGLLASLVVCDVFAAQPFDAGPYMHAQRLVDIGGGRHLNLYCTGSGSPTVLLDADGDDGTPAWRFVQPDVAQYTRVCSYDSAGIGFSDPMLTTRDANVGAADLHALITHAGIPLPIVLVGYVNSGLSDRLYAGRYPSDVAGMVLVAPVVPNQREVMTNELPVLANVWPKIDQYKAKCFAASQRGEIRSIGPFADCRYTPPDPTLPQELKDLIGQQSEGPNFWRTLTLWDEKASAAEVAGEQRSYGALPLIVLTTTKDIFDLPIPKEQQIQFAATWMRWHDSIAALSTRGSNTLVEDSTLSIPIDKPAAVISAIDGVVATVRGR
jgi:pimeloyl-ACP methyl ester carboxylesterase